MICLYDSKETNFNNNGIVVLSNCRSAYVEERLNDIYEYSIEYPLDSRNKWQNMLEGNIIKSSDGQLFRIYHKVKTLSGVLVNARHIFYDLLDNFLEDVRPTNLNGIGALNWILSNTQYPNSFTAVSDISTVNTKYFVRKNVVEAIMGQDGIIVNWGGELVRDNFIIKLLQARGLDRGVLVSYGKNIIGIEETIDTDSILTRLMPVGKDGLLLPEKYIDSPYINNFPHPKIKVVEFSDKDNEADLRTAAQSYFADTKSDIPQFNYKVDFVELSKTVEYKDYAILETVYLGDTVTIKHSRLNINLKAKVIRIKKNDITGRIEEVELGSFRPNLSNAFSALANNIKALSADIVQVKSDYQNAIDNATSLITGSKGGNVVINRDANGHPYEILIMDTTNALTSKNVWRWNSGGFGYSSTGYNGTFSTAITSDGHIVGSFITALTVTGEMIKAGIIQSKTGKWLFNLDGESINLGNKLTFDGTNLSIKLSNGSDLDASISSKVNTNDMGTLITQNASSVKVAVGQIGGNNLLKNGGFEFGTANWYANSSLVIFTNEQSNTNFSGKSLMVSDSQTSDSTLGTISGGIFQNVNNLIVGKKYTLSAYLFVQAVGGVYYALSQNGEGLVNTPQNNGWTKVSQTFTATSSSMHIYFLIMRNNSAALSDRSFYLDNVKLEEGENPTSWTPNPNELKNSSFEVTDDHARFTSSDGSYTEFTPNTTGLKWHKASTSHDYHYLSYGGTASVAYGSDVILQLPDEFKNKDFKVLTSVKATLNDVGLSMLVNVGAFGAVENQANGTVRLSGLCSIMTVDSAGNYVSSNIYKILTISYLVIA